MNKKKNIFNFSIKITVLVIFIALFVVNACNSETINKPNDVNQTSIKPDKSKTLTQDILDENGKKLFKITVENIGDMLETSGMHSTLLLDNGKVIIGKFFGYLEIFDPNTSKFNYLRTNKFNYLKNTTTYGPIFLKDNNLYYSPFFIYDPETNKIIEHYKDKVHKKIDKYQIKMDNFIKSKKEPSKCYLLKNKTNKLICLTNYKNNKGVINNFQTIILKDINEFTQSKKAKLNIARTDYDCIMLKNGEILIIGGSRKNKDGFEEGLKSIEMYNPKSGEVKLVGNMHYPRIAPKSILLKDGRVLITGGYIHTKKSIKYSEILTRSFLKYFDNAEIFDPKTSKLTFVGDYKQIFHMTDRNDYYQLGLLKDGKVLLYGSHINLFDPKVNKFYQTDLRNPISRNDHQLTVLNNGKTLITGGTVGDCFYGEDLKSAELVTIENY